MESKDSTQRNETSLQVRQTAEYIHDLLVSVRQMNTPWRQETAVLNYYVDMAIAEAFAVTQGQSSTISMGAELSSDRQKTEAELMLDYMTESID